MDLEREAAAPDLLIERLLKGERYPGKKRKKSSRIPKVHGGGLGVGKELLCKVRATGLSGIRK